MSMEPFKSLRAVALPIAQPNFDTDQILPARFLQKPRALNFGEFLFRDLRYRSDGSENPDFVLNEPAYKSARIVVGEANFGCGSSREHAVWALYDYGIRAVIAPSMGDIFMSNAAKNGLLTIVLPAPAVAGMIAATLATPGL
jgi:3-isopropylmalate/(R)-2-methylmalate dehydratase small subunit